MKKQLRWGSKDDIVLTIELDREAVEWLVLHLPKNDGATKQLEHRLSELRLRDML